MVLILCRSHHRYHSPAIITSCIQFCHLICHDCYCCCCCCCYFMPYVFVCVCECVASTPSQASICRCVILPMIRVLVSRHQNWLVMQWLFIGSVSIYVVFYGKSWSIQIVDHCMELVRLDECTIQECSCSWRLFLLNFFQFEMKWNGKIYNRLRANRKWKPIQSDKYVHSMRCICSFQLGMPAQ